MHENSGLDAQHPHLNTLQYSLNLDGWQRSQVIEHAKACEHFSLNSTAEEVGYIAY